MREGNALQVFYDEKLVGTLAMTADHKAAFQYSEEWIENGFPISPFSLPLKKQVFVPTKDYFDGLFGVFADSLPDNWGRLLLNRLLRAHKQNPDKLTVLDRLAIVGKSGMGALTFVTWRRQEKMTIRKAEEKDIPRIIELLGQVLQIHADIRPDIFIPGTTKYTVSQLTELLGKEEKPIYVAVNEEDVCVGYAFCQLQEQPFSTNMVPFKSLFIDDLCVDQQARGQHIGESLFEYVKNEAKRMGCYEVTLNVWAGNTSAEKFYEKMGMKTKERQMEYILEH